MYMCRFTLFKKLMTNKCCMKVPTLSGGFMVSETNYTGL